jgi:hypothetical protein
MDASRNPEKRGAVPSNRALRVAFADLRMCEDDLHRAIKRTRKD